MAITAGSLATGRTAEAGAASAATVWGDPFWHRALPLAVFVGYFAAVKLVPDAASFVLSGERGLIEVTTAVLFAAAAWGGVRIARNAALPRRYRAWFVAFALAAVLVTGEEVSWGQHFLGWTTPSWFAEHNVNHETNLHNLFHNKPSRKFQQIAHLSFPVFFFALPLWLHRRRRPARPGEWRWYLLPGLELAAIAALSFAANAPNKTPEWFVDPPWRGPELREVQELFWGWAVFGYTRVIDKRLR